MYKNQSKSKFRREVLVESTKRLNDVKENLKLSEYEIKSSYPYNNLNKSSKNLKVVQQSILNHSQMPSIGNIQKRTPISTSRSNKTKINKKNNLDIKTPRLTSNLLLNQSTVKNNIKAILEEKKNRKLERKIEEKKEYQELNDLKSKRDILRKQYERTKDGKSMAMISKKIMHINERISKIIKKQKQREVTEMREYHNEEEEDNFTRKSNLLVDVNDKSIVLESEDSFDKFLKQSSTFKPTTDKGFYKYSKENLLTQENGEQENQMIYNTAKIIEPKFISPAIDQNFFIKKQKAYLKMQKKHNDNSKVNEIMNEYKLLEHKDRVEKDDNTRKYEDFHFLRNVDENNLFIPSTNFSQEKTLLKKSYKPSGFRKEYNEHKNRRQRNYSTINSKSLDDIIDNYLFDHELIKSKNNDNDTEIKKFVPKSAFLTASSDKTQPKPRIQSAMDSNVAEKFKNLFSNLIKDSKTIKNEIFGQFINSKRKFLDDDYDNLLLLFEKKEKKETYKPRVKIKTREEERIHLLNKVKGPVREILNEAFKKIMYEDRILNKRDPSQITKEEMTLAMHKMKKDFRKIALETMFLTGNHLDNGKDEEIKEIFKHHYANIDNMEWQIKKRKILRNTLPKFFNAK
jgi:hypothetical protein